MIAVDANMALYLNGLDDKSAVFDDTIIFFASYLPWLLVAAFLLWLYFSSSPTKEKIYILCVTAMSALIARFGVTEIIRFFYHRPRPFMVYPKIHALFVDNEWAFPSGHATFFFAMASATFFFNKKWGTALFISTIAVTTSRVVAGVHYPSDILGGMLIGIAVAYIVFYLAEKWRNKIIK